MFRRHAEARVRTFVHATRRTEAGFIDGFGHILRFFERSLEHMEPARVPILFRRQADHRLEGALQVKTAETGARGQALEGQRFVRMSLDVAAELVNPRQLGTNRGFRPAASARTQAIAFGQSRRRIKTHVTAQRTAGRARRPTIHSRGPHSEQKQSVEAAVPLLHGFPALLRVHHKTSMPQMPEAIHPIVAVQIPRTATYRLQ